MSIIVDGYNYIGRSREFDLNDPEAKNKLIYLFGQYCSKVHKALTLVFDGNVFVDQANRKRRYGRVTVIYTSPIYTADDLIKKMVREQAPKHRQAVLIVSSDEEILNYAKTHGTAVMRSPEFERTIERAFAAEPEADRANLRVSAAEVQEWLKIFEEKHPDAGEPQSPEKRRQIGLPPRPAIAPATPSPPAKPKPAPPSSHSRIRPTRQDRQPARAGMSEDDEAQERSDVYLSSAEVEEWLKIFGAKAKK